MILTLSSKQILIYNEELLVAFCFSTFLILSRRSFGQTFEGLLDGRLEAIREELQEFLNPNESLLLKAKEENSLKRDKFSGKNRVSQTLMYLLAKCVLLVTSLVVASFLQKYFFLFSNLKFLIILVTLFLFFTLFYRILLLKRRHTFAILVFVLLCFIIGLLISWIRFNLLTSLVSTGLMSSIIFYVSSGSDEEYAHSLPALESESSSVSLLTFRNVLAADYEQSIYQSIRDLEAKDYYRIPAQNLPGQYEQLVRHNFDQAASVNCLREILDIEYWAVKILEKKGALQDGLFDLMLTEPNLSNILRISPYENLREGAFDFLEEEFSENEIRHIQIPRLDDTISILGRDQRTSEIYKKFMDYFIDGNYRRQNGLPFPQI